MSRKGVGKVKWIKEAHMDGLELLQDVTWVLQYLTRPLTLTQVLTWAQILTRGNRRLSPKSKITMYK